MPPRGCTTPSISPTCPSGHDTQASTTSCTSSPDIITYAQSVLVSAAPAGALPSSHWTSCCHPQRTQQWAPRCQTACACPSQRWKRIVGVGSGSAQRMHPAGDAGQRTWGRVWQACHCGLSPREMHAKQFAPAPIPRCRGHQAQWLPLNESIHQRQRRPWCYQNGVPPPMSAPASC